jgi:hypothetical protein
VTISIANKYFDYWSSKNLEALDEIIHSDCILEDWQTKIYGKAEIKDFNEAFFETNNIKLKINNMIESNNEVWSYLTITINDKEVIEVVDILSFSENQVISIKAFKG